MDIETGRIAQSEWPPAQNCEFPTCHYIAACNPVAMAALLAHIDAQAAEIERLRADEMDAVASKHAHKLALDLECVLADYSGKWWDAAMQTLGAYREAMNAIHERESPTWMGEPVIAAAPQPAAQPEHPTPAWHNAPTCAGLWLCDEGDSNPYCFTTHPVTWPLNSMLLGEGERWYGPIPKDDK